jgi:hypothetical protein
MRNEEADIEEELLKKLSKKFLKLVKNVVFT